jgi:uncharacterized membrane protein YciS (DUF1049 family)
MRAVVIVLTLAFFTLLIWVAVANQNETVTVSLGFEKARETTLATVIFSAAGAGVVFIGVLALIEGLSLRVENLRLRRRLRQLEDELTDLRNVALKQATPAGLDGGGSISVVPPP